MHFERTAQLFDKVTHDYRNLYEHLALSARQLSAIPGESSEARLAEPELRQLGPVPPVPPVPAEDQAGAPLDFAADGADIGQDADPEPAFDLEPASDLEPEPKPGRDGAEPPVRLP